MSKTFNGNWILTDDDSVQYFESWRPREGDKLFELFQVQAVAESTENDPKIYQIAHEFIYRSEIDVEDVLDGYCYDSLEEMKEIYGDKTDQMLAECQFEFDASGGENLITRMPLMTWNEAKDMIEKLVNTK